MEATAAHSRSRIPGRTSEGCWHWPVPLVLLALVLIPGIAVRADSPPTEYQVQAAFMLNFAEFIHWPAGAFHDAKSPLVIGVLGPDPFGKVLEHTFDGTKIDGHPVVIRRSRNVDDLRNAQMIYISPSERDRLEEILASIDAAPTVTISEISGFCWRGGIINFYIDENHVRFEINVGAARRHGLKISSQLLSRARLVGNDSASAGK